MIKIQTQLWDMAQDEMEKIRNAPFEDLESSEIEKTDVFGQIQVELMNPRRKRVTVLLRHKQALSQPVVVATLVHKQGLRR